MAITNPLSQGPRSSTESGAGTPSGADVTLQDARERASGLVPGPSFMGRSTLKTFAIVLFVLAATSSVSARQDLTKEDVLKLKTSGANDAVILKAIMNSGRKFDLTTDDVVTLIAGGLSEQVVNAMLGASPPSPPADPARTPAPLESRTRLAAENKTSETLWVRVDAKRGEVLFAPSQRKGMTAVPKGKSAEMEVGRGSYKVRWAGAQVDLGFILEEGKSVTLRIVERDEDGCCSLAIQLVRDEKEKPAVPSSDPKTLYVCPMHPEVTSKTAGTCPKCGMKLELPKPKPPEKKKDAHDHDHSK